MLSYQMMGLWQCGQADQSGTRRERFRGRRKMTALRKLPTQSPTAVQKASHQSVSSALKRAYPTVAARGLQPAMRAVAPGFVAALVALADGFLAGGVDGHDDRGETRLLPVVGPVAVRQVG